MEQPNRIKNDTDISAALAAGAALGTAKDHETPDAKPYAVIPIGYSIEELPTQHKPSRPTSTVKLRDAASFSKYVSDHKRRETRIYAIIEPPRFLAVMDDHLDDTIVGTLDIDNGANWREFRALFDIPFSREFKLWSQKHKIKMSQLEFAEFLQDNLPDVSTPDGATLLEMALNFEASSSGSFVATQRLKDGSTNLEFRAENQASGTVQLPNEITLLIPIFENESATELQARLRYRVPTTADGKFTIWYELVRPHKAIEQAFRNTWTAIATATQAPILLGTPE
jgi:uncharacterized protein YfdQ (DUF2303 family)